MKIVWNRHALEDRGGGMEYVAKDSPVAAIEMDIEIEQQVDALATYPELGRSGRVPGTRELVISRTPYIAVYRVDTQENHVEILRVLTNWQQWP